MRKIISLLASVAMMVTASATVFAATPADANPKATITLVGDETKTRVINGETYYMYTATVDMEGIGTLDCTPAAADNSYNVGTRLVQLEIGYVGDLQAGAGAGSTTKLGSGSHIKQIKATESGAGFNGILFQYAATADTLAFPVNPTDDVANLGEDMVVSKFYGKPGDTFTMFKDMCILGYETFIFSEDDWAVKDSGDGVTYANITYDKEVYTLPTFGKVEELTFEVTPEAKQSNGYVWTANVTKGEADITGLTAKFTAGEEVAERAVRNVADLNKFVGEGNLTFNIGLKTQKTLTAAEFSITDGTDTITANPAVAQ